MKTLRSAIPVIPAAMILFGAAGCENGPKDNRDPVAIPIRRRVSPRYAACPKSVAGAWHGKPIPVGKQPRPWKKNDGAETAVFAVPSEYGRRIVLLEIPLKEGRPDESVRMVYGEFFGSDPGGVGEIRRCDPDHGAGGSPLDFRACVALQTKELETRVARKKSAASAILASPIVCHLADASFQTGLTAVLGQIDPAIRPTPALEPGFSDDDTLDIDTGESPKTFARVMEQLNRKAGGAYSVTLDYPYLRFSPAAQIRRRLGEGKAYGWLRTEGATRAKAALEDTDAVEIYVLENKDFPPNAHRAHPPALLPGITFALPGEPASGVISVARLNGDEARALAKRLADNIDPSGSGAMCHFPAYGVRFRKAGRMVFESTLCFGCGNLVVPSRAFDERMGRFKESGTLCGLGGGALLERLQKIAPLPEEPKADTGAK